MMTAPKVFRLRDILTHEVSLVDRAANKRVFLLQKNEEGKPVESDGQGGFKTQEPTPPTDPQSPAQPTPEPPKDPAQPPAPPKEGEEPKKDEPLEVTKATYEGICRAIEQLTTLAKSVTPSDTLKLDTEAITARFAEALKDVEFTAPRTVPAVWEDGVWKCASSVLKKELKKASEKLAEVADSLAIDTSDNPPPHEVRWRIVDVLENLVEFTRFEVAQAAMAKRSEPEQYASIVKGLESVLASELRGAAPAEAVDTAYVSKLVQTADEVIKALRSHVKKQEKRIEQLEAEPLPSHRLPVGEGREVRKSQEVVWPRDMNEKVPDDDLRF
jgi:hypothetical protein